MNNLSLFLLKSTLSLSLLYLVFRLLMRNETFFKLSRMALLFIVCCSLLIPFLHAPKLLQPLAQVELQPISLEPSVFELPVPVTDNTARTQLSQPVREMAKPVTLSASAIFSFVYFSGVFVSILLLIYSIRSVLKLFRNARKVDLDGICLMVVADDISALSFGRNILISQHDYDTNSEAIITHEQSHIRMGHFYDLMLMELVKIIFWFNPLVYLMVRDLKEIHEFQADEHTLNSGIDASQYQLLIIKKCVGHQRFALANSFNHCRIKKRIAMMNKQKLSRASIWKVVALLALLPLLLLVFGRKENAVSREGEIPSRQDRVLPTGNYLTEDSVDNVLNQPDTVIAGKQFIIRDTTQYDPSFIRSLRSHRGHELMKLIDDTLFYSYRPQNKPDTLVRISFPIPTNLPLNESVGFSSASENKMFSLFLKRVNYTNIEYQLRQDGKGVKSGVAILQSSFYFGKENDLDENGNRLDFEQYIDSGRCGAILKVEIEQAQRATFRFCTDEKTEQWQHLPMFKRQ